MLARFTDVGEAFPCFFTVTTDVKYRNGVLLRGSLGAVFRVLVSVLGLLSRSSTWQDQDHLETASSDKSASVKGVGKFVNTDTKETIITVELQSSGCTVRVHVTRCRFVKVRRCNQP